MIHLDTNYLMGLLVKGSPQALEADGWLASGESLAASAIVWTEFLNGPVTPSEVSSAEAVLQSQIIPFGQAEAKMSAELFNKTGRRRGSRFDCLIAATAAIAQAQIATVNQADFKAFVPHGLKLARPPVPAQPFPPTTTGPSSGTIPVP
jgi:predicted nucleic acid-binding protein